MPDTVARFTVSVPPELLVRFDEVSAGKGYASRSEAVRDALRDYLVAHEWADGRMGPEEAVASLTLLCDPRLRPLPDEVLAASSAGVRLLCSTRVPLPEGFVEVLVLRGSRQAIGAAADELISLRSVKHGRLVAAALGPLP